jgi:hypothetical protein
MNQIMLTCESSKTLLDPLHRVLQSRIEIFRIATPRLGEIGPTATAAAHLFGDHLNQFARGNAIALILGDARNQTDLAAIDGRQYDNGTAQLVL